LRNLAYRVQEAHGVLVECIGDEITDARIRQWQCTGVKLEEAGRETGIQNENTPDSRFPINTKPLLDLLPPDPNRMTPIVSDQQFLVSLFNLGSNQKGCIVYDCP
jgi:hypothetical protein